MSEITETTLEWMGIDVKVQFEFDAHDETADIRCVTVLRDGQEVCEITEFMNHKGIAHIEQQIVDEWRNEYIKENPEGYRKLRKESHRQWIIYHGGVA